MKTGSAHKADPRFLLGQQVIGHRYWVQCKEFRCMAVADYDGKWKDFHSGKQLTSEVLFFWQ
jgi:hypothetical protein